MKQLRLASLALASAALMPYLASCSSDRNPFDLNISTEKNTAVIRLNLDVAATRAEEDLSTDREEEITKASVYVFDGDGKLETFEEDLEVSSGSPAELEVAPGLKTIYVIASNSVMESTLTAGITMSSFESRAFASTLTDLNPDDGFVMIGKSGTQQVLKSANKTEMPSSNVFNIDMVRLVAKTQVKFDATDASSFGFTIGSPSFRVSQTCDKMRIVADPSSDIQESYSDTDGDGTYDGYSVCGDLDFLNTVTDGFTADGCHYMSENIVLNPVAGNTTFVSLCVPFTPAYYYSYDAANDVLTVSSEEGVDGATFYAVGIIDELYGFEDFALDPATKHVVVFKTSDEAEAYERALNGGETSAVTVSETESPLRAGAEEASEINVRNFKAVAFDGGKAYYRINIAGADNKLKVERNKFYRITVNRVTNLGFHSERLLRPKAAASNPGNSTSAWIQTVLTVADWDSVDQSVNL